METFHERFVVRSRMYLLKYTVYMFIGIIYPPAKPNFTYTYFDYYHLKVSEKIHPFASKSDFSSLLLVHISKEKKTNVFHECTVVPDVRHQY